MNLKTLMKKLDFAPSKQELDYLKKETAIFTDLLKTTIKKQKVDVDVFVGGSFAKGTMAKSVNYDVDMFIRFDWKYENLSVLLEKILKPISREMLLPLTKLHGSRDYFRIHKSNKLTFEIIPVVRVKKVKEARNVTDLSYFHVNYVKKNIGKGSNDVRFAKQFCKAQRAYGAESYINGFSGYALECLIIHYGGFEKMLKALVKVKDREVIDLVKHYKKKNDVFFEMNESKIHGPIILVDPTWKERNVLAALNQETFGRFKKAAKKFLLNPSEKHFEMQEINQDKFVKSAKKKNAEFINIQLISDRQEGDIAGTKMKKFSRFITQEMSKYFDILNHDYSYVGEKTADFYLIVKSKKEIIKIGPPLDSKKHVVNFKKKNKNTFVDNNVLHAKIKVGFTGKQFIEKLYQDRKEEIIKMGVIKLTIN